MLNRHIKITVELLKEKEPEREYQEVGFRNFTVTYLESFEFSIESLESLLKSLDTLKQQFPREID